MKKITQTLILAFIALFSTVMVGHTDGPDFPNTDMLCPTTLITLSTQQ